MWSLQTLKERVVKCTCNCTGHGLQTLLSTLSWDGFRTSCQSCYYLSPSSRAVLQLSSPSPWVGLAAGSLAGTQHGFRPTYLYLPAATSPLCRSLPAQCDSLLRTEMAKGRWPEGQWGGWPGVRYGGQMPCPPLGGSLLPSGSLRRLERV